MQAGMRLKTLKLSFLFNSQNHNKSLEFPQIKLATHL